MARICTCAARHARDRPEFPGVPIVKGSALCALSQCRCIRCPSFLWVGDAPVCAWVFGFLCLHRFCGSSSATLVSNGSARPCSWHFRSRTRSNLETLLAYSSGNALTSSRYGRTSHAAWALEATPVAGVARTNAALHGAPEAPR